METLEVSPSRRRRLLDRTSGSFRVSAVSALLAASALLLYVHTVSGLTPVEAGLAVPWWVLAGMFACTEIFVIYIHLRRDAHSISLSELPLVLGLAFTAPVAFVAARILGAAVALIAHRRPPLIKLVFNIAHLGLEACLAVTIYHAVLGDASPVEPRGWAAAFIATLVTDIYAACTITAVISLYEGRFEVRTLLQVLAAGTVAAGANTSLALVAVITLERDVSALWLLGVVAAILFLAYRSYTSLSQGYARLELLYGFTRAVGRSVEADPVMEAMLTEARGLLRAEVAEIRLFEGERSALVITLRAEGTMQVDELAVDEAVAGGPWWEPAARGEGLIVPRTTRDERVRLQLVDRGHKDAMAVPLRGEVGVVGVAIVANRLGDVSTFDREDLKLFETLANHASVSLENGRLVDRIRQEAQEKEYQALHDPLTGLPNRRLFVRSVDEALTRPRPGAESLAIMLMDLDRFKEINDTLGHHTGDQLLSEVGNRLTRTLIWRGTVARLGGDEFAILLPEVAGAEDSLAVARDVLTALEQPMTVSDLTLDIGASIGVALAPLHGGETSLLLQRADVAMYSAKAAHSGAEVYDPERDQYSPRRLALVGELRRALESRQLDVHYQPKADLTTGRVVGAEALLRWDDPERGRVPPDEFIPVAEHTGLIRPLTLYVLEEALYQCASWRRSGMHLGVAVNLSVRSLVEPTLPDDVDRLLRRTEVHASDLTLEITESSIMGDPTRTLSVLDRLHGLGVKLAIDDFGTGYSSLSYLKRLPVDEVKIDKSFVLDMAEDADDAAIVRSTIDLGHNLGLRVVAEGVENQDVWDRLARLGCDVAQGYLIGRPVLPADFEDWLALRRSGTEVGRRQPTDGARLGG